MSISQYVGGYLKMREADKKRKEAGFEGTQLGRPLFNRTDHGPAPEERNKRARYAIVKAMAEEATLTWMKGAKRQIAISLSGKEIAPDASPLTDPDIIGTCGSYSIMRRTYDPVTLKLHEEEFIIACDVLRPKPAIRLRNWEEAVAIANGDVEPRPGLEIDPETLRWVIRNTQLSRRLFVMAALNPGLEIPFTIDWERYMRARNDENPERLFRLRTLKLEGIEGMRMRMREINARYQSCNDDFVLQHQRTVAGSWNRLLWTRNEAIDRLRKKVGEENVRLFPGDYSEMSEAYRKYVLKGGKNVAKVQKAKWRVEDAEKKKDE